tara:strand:+ start:503 stop:688 length:186 start_codon:yes stop_codon:yes gene_type:complete
MQEPLSQRFSMTYKQVEAPVYIPMEKKLMKRLGMSRGDVHKIALRNLNNQIENQKLNLMVV